MTAVLFKFKYPDGEPVVGAPFTVSLRKSSFDEENDEGILLPGDVQGLTDQAGKATLELSPGYGVYYLTMSPEGAQADVDGCVPGLRYKFIVPESDTPVRVEDLIVTVPTWSRPWDEVALAVIIEAKTESQAAATAAQSSAVASFQDAERSKVSAAEALSHKNAAANSASTAATLAEQARVSAVNSGNSATAAAQSATQAANALGTKQDKHANLTALSGLTGAPNRVPYFTGLGVLSLATLNATVNDNVLGQILRVGDHGLGSLSTPPIADLNNPVGSGFYWVTSGTTNQMVGFASGSQVLTAGASDAEVAQLLFSRSTPMRVAIRRKTSSNWQPPQEVVFGSVVSAIDDAAAGKLLTVGYAGRNGGVAMVKGANTVIGDLKGAMLYACNSTYTDGPPWVTGPVFVENDVHGFGAAGYAVQRVWGITNPKNKGVRCLTNGVYSPWEREIFLGDFGLGGDVVLDTAYSWSGSRFKGWQASAPDSPPINSVSVGLDMGYAENRRFQMALDGNGKLYTRINITAAPNTGANWKTIIAEGDYGLGSQVVPLITDYASDIKPGFYFSYGATNASAPANGPVGSGGGSVGVVALQGFNNANFKSFLGVSQAGGPGTLFVGSKAAAGAPVWNRVVTQESAILDPALNTGGIVSSGSNANGTYTKYADGSLDMYHFMSLAHTADAELVTGWTFPHPALLGGVTFAGIAAVVTTQNYDEKKMAISQSSTTAASLRSKISTTQSCTINLFFKGRWK